MLKWLEHAWYQNDMKAQLSRWLLSPLTLLFWLVSVIRRWLFTLGVKKTVSIDAPVIIVGNISVGGNGKTPLVIWLAHFLRSQGYSPGVLSRGYGGNATNYPISVTPQSLASDVGDEPLLMIEHIKCPLVVDPIRARGASSLQNKHACDVIICDDGLQHYALARDIELVVIDGQRRLGNGFLLPMGPLREGKWRLSTVDFVVCNGGNADKGEYAMHLAPSNLVNVKNPERTKLLSELSEPVIAAAAIGNPQRFFSLLQHHKLALKSCLSFKDHHQFTADDLPQDTVLMTEKDAVKCRDFAHDDWWYLPVSAQLNTEFEQQLLTKLKII